MPYAGRDFSPRTIGEQPLLSIDFTPWLASGETVDSATVTLAVSSGTDSVVASRVTGPASLSDAVVSQLFDFSDSPGTLTSGNIYLVSFIAVTSLGETLVCYSRVQVLEAA